MGLDAPSRAYAESLKFNRGLSFGASLSILFYGSLEYAVDGKLDHPYLFAIPLCLALGIFRDNNTRIANLERIANN